jgi:ubiquitin-conjugating enzyme E2 S
MKLILSHEYPGAPPKGYFLTKIYHPNVASNGDICVNTLKKDWNPNTTLKHVLQVIRCLLIVPFPESSLNDEAGKLFMDDYEDFARRAELMTNVHATDDDEENDESTEKESATVSIEMKGKGVVKAEEGSTEENIVPTENSSHRITVGNKESTEGSGKYDASMDTISSKGSTKKTSSSKESSKKSKEKDIKKKSLKRL